MKIQDIDFLCTNHPSGLWICIDRNLYDGSPDSGYQYVGWGETQEKAKADLIEQLADDGLLEDS